MRIQNINYSTNNYSVKLSKKQQNPSFGKLIIDKGECIPTEILQAVAKNEELQKLVRIFHEKGIDLTLLYDGMGDIEHDLLSGLLLCERNKFGFTKGTVVSFHEYIARRSILAQINELKNGFAERVYNKYLKEQAKLVNDTHLRQGVQNSIDSFNKSLR